VAAVLVAVAIPLLPRLVTTSTIELRLAIWVAAIGRWLESPIVGLGPGSFAHEFTLSGYYRTYEANVPHAHNLLVQVLFESGVLGLLAVGLICIAVIRAMADRGRLEWAPVTAIAFLVFASSTDNPSVVPVLIAPLIVWTAAATPRLRDKGARRAAARRPLILAAASVVALASLATHVAAWSFENARAASARGDTATVITELSRATLLDPAFALYHRELGVWLQSNGSSNIAERELRSAIRLNASDTQGYRALALLLAKSGDETRAIEWASRADHMQATNAQNALTLAYVAAELGDRATEQAALVSAVRRYPWIMAAPEWTDIFPYADLYRSVADAIDSWSGDGASPRTARAQAWLAGFAGVDPPATTTHAQRVESATLACRSQVASDVLNELEGRAASRIDALEARLIFGRAYGGKDVGEILALMRLRDPGQAQLASLHASGTSPVSNAFYDDRYYDRIAIPPPPGPTFPTPASGLSAWLTDPIAAADRGAPMSALAACR
jgi:hypothetical protein